MPDVTAEAQEVWSHPVTVPSPPKELGAIIASAMLSSNRTKRICEVNPASLELANAILDHVNGSKGNNTFYAALPYREARTRPAGWQVNSQQIKVVAPSSRSVRGPVEDKLGVFDTMVIGADAEHSALRASVLFDLPLLVQHLSEDSLVVMHGFRCDEYHGARAEYRGPFWIGNLSVPCWHERFHSLVASGALLQPVCRSLGHHNAPLMLDGHEKDRGEYMACTATFRSNVSVCETQRPLLESWSDQDAKMVNKTSRTCHVRKEIVVLQSNSKLWGKQGWLKRPSLSHLFRRHIRYFGAFSCDEEQVCMIFKDEIDEQWVAGLNSSDGLNFIGDPALVLPKSPARATLYTTLAAVLDPKGSALDTLRDGALWDVPRRRASWPKGPLGAPMPSDVFKWPAPCVKSKSAEWNDTSAPICYDGPLGRRFLLMMGSMTHNLALTRHKGEWIAIGGRHNGLTDRPDKISPLFSGDQSQHAAPGWWKPTADLLDQQYSEWPDRYATAGWPARLNALAPNSSIEKRLRRALGPSDAHRLDVLPKHLDNPGTPRRGLWMMRGSSWRYDANEDGSHWLTPVGGVNEPAKSPWRDKQLVIDGHHPGCVEKREPSSSGDFFHLLPGGVCEYDGRLSLVSFQNELLLFTRSNPAARGSRHVQVTRSSDDGSVWSPFQQVHLDGYSGGGDIYFFAVQVNPVHEQSLLAVFPIVHRIRGCIAVATSMDGVRWTKITPLLSCSIYGERTMDQPALPAMVRRGNEVWLYVHEEVPGITIDRATPRFAYAQMAANEKPSQVVRYSFSCSKLANWTQSALREWQLLYRPQQIPKAPFRSDCPGQSHLETENQHHEAQEVQGSAKGTCAWKPRKQDPTRNVASPVQGHTRKRRGRSRRKARTAPQATHKGR